MKDGLYRVETKRFVAGFVIADGKIIAMAPILRSNILFWINHAIRIDDDPTAIRKTDGPPTGGPD